MLQSSVVLANSDCKMAGESASSMPIRDTSTAVVSSPRVQRRKKPHLKTRQGCFQCKRRKVKKCSEDPISCKSCVRHGWECVYPSSKESREAQMRMLWQPAIPQTQSMVEAYGGKLEYTALDMRLLHEFIINAYPRLPLGCEDVWTRDVPAMAHEYRYLMHSILALASSNLVKRGHPALMPAAHHHRLRAMQGVNESLARSDRSANDDDALMASCYSLAFQVACSGDTPKAFWIMVRTIKVVKSEIVSRSIGSKFPKHMVGGTRNEPMMERLRHVPPLRRSLVLEALEGLQAMERLCKPGLEMQLCGLMARTLQGLLESSLAGYMAMTRIYDYIATMSAYEFSRLTNPNEDIIQLLQSHFVALQTLIAIFSKGETKEGRVIEVSKDPDVFEGAIRRWAVRATEIPDTSNLRQHLEWPSKLQLARATGSLWDDLFESESSYS